MYCSHCGKELSPEAWFCPNCGQMRVASTVPVVANHQKSSLEFTENIKLCLIEKYCTIEGRATRGEYWKFMLFVGLLILVVEFPLVFITGMFMNVADSNVPFFFFFFISVAAWLALLPPIITCEIRRYHDTGFSGWWYFLHLIPGGSFILLIFTLLPSQMYENEYGPLPDYTDHVSKKWFNNKKISDI